MPIKMKTLKPHRYGTRHMTAGQEYEVPGESHARVVEEMKWAERAKAAPPEKPVPVAVPAPAPRAVAAKTPRGRWSRAANEDKPAEPTSPTEPRDHGPVGGLTTQD